MKRKEYIWAYLFVAAPILGFMLFALIPLSYSVYVSFTDYSGYTAPVFNGGDNYVKLVKDELFWKTLLNTVIFLFAKVLR
ncbi:hypothetical protein PAJ34TS1_30450 [Paenibacillus azoreducens]|uniref:Sugar ABC transporter permease n=2 Tax=Paenibacillus azoreducens TaxID=116718 RepID=A0A919YDG6_9BACL|nr:hypothetical protein J34TS1_18250 [Paenibacillus azoreducens]